MSKVLRVLGLMSGTSLDGIDVAFLETDGEAIVKRGPSATYAYDAKQQALLRQALADAEGMEERNERPGILAEAETALTDWHAKAVESFCQQHGLSDSKPDLIGFHGQTVLHRPDKHLTVQLGDGAALAKATGIEVAYDLRAADIAAGGQGAPLVPIYHAALSPERPTAFVNIGGVANITYISKTGELLAFDTGPGNALLNDWMLKKQGTDFDEGGAFSSFGTVSPKYLATMMAHPYFAVPPPKSLDRNTFALVYLGGLSSEDGAATLAAFTVAAIAKAAAHLPDKPKQWVICGGGRHNAAMMQGLRASLSGVVSAEDIGLNGDSMEAEAWAYLAVRAKRGLPITFPGTTGVEHPMTGGVFAKP
ncbi:anhydro-N-acetylmuramic acid kinase [Aestuariivirga litoralis]|nr:anhydro-N-acetylmuramic acid kinase [Aestuariivirga litoralis]MBG1231901.1 anhydro-N-acetylmuramic acid kinase [Aestuariivirga litoralis]